MFHEIVELLYRKKPTHNLEIPTYIIQSEIGKHFSYFSHLEVSVYTILRPYILHINVLKSTSILAENALTYRL